MTLCLMLLLSLGLTSVAHAHPLGQQGSSPAFPHANDVGQVAHKGATVVDGDTYRIWGSGNDIWDWHDQFHYAWTQLSGDGQVVVQVQKQEATDQWAKAGIMLRSSLDDNAANVFLALAPAHGVAFQWRAANNERTRQWSGPSLHVPSWLKLVRYAQTVTGYVSLDGTTWTRVSSITLPMQANSMIGLAVTAHNNRTRSRTLFTHVQLTVGSTPPSQTAAQVYGQMGCFNTNNINNSNNVSATSLAEPWGIAFDRNSNLYVADFNNNRVLYFPAGRTNPTHVYGQSGCLTSANGGTSATSFSGPNAVALDNHGNLYVSDAGNNRVLYFPAGSTTATRVYGQPDFTGSACNQNGSTSATTLCWPSALVLDNSGDLYINDYANERVLYYPVGSTTPTRVYGQPDFTSNTGNNGGISATSLLSPSALALDSSGNLYVGDAGNNRILKFPAGSTTATSVYGQSNFTTGTANTGGISATSLSGPVSLMFDNSDNLFAADIGNSRVLYYPVGSTTATRVYGQPDFVTGTANIGGISATSLSSPMGLALDGSGDLYVADSGNNRMLKFPQS